MVGRGAPEPKRSWRADKTLLARQAHRSENPPASAVGSVNWKGMCREDWEDYLKRASPWYDPEDDIDYEEEDDEHDDEEA